jgi:dihydroorotate dehydrogenase electron transfer subunit
MTSKNCSKTADPRSCRVVANRALRPDVGRLTFRSPPVARSARPGQFLHVRVSGLPHPLLRRPFSVHDVAGDRVSILYRIVGTGTGLLSRLRTGETVDIAGPLGNPFTAVPGAPGHLVVAGGIGIAPMQFLLRRLTSLRLSPRLFYGCPSKRDLLPHLAVDRVLATDDGTCGARGFVTAALERELDRHPGAAVYACGPWPMLRETARICRQRGLRCQVSLEARMACGVGACQGCVVRGAGSYLTVCHDGPVFDAGQIDWEQEFVL